MRTLSRFGVGFALAALAAALMVATGASAGTAKAKPDRALLHASDLGSGWAVYESPAFTPAAKNTPSTYACAPRTPEWDVSFVSGDSSDPDGEVDETVWIARNAAAARKAWTHCVKTHSVRVSLGVSLGVPAALFTDDTSDPVHSAYMVLLVGKRVLWVKYFDIVWGDTNINGTINVARAAIWRAELVR